MEKEDLEKLRSYCYANTDVELAEKVQKEIDLCEEKEELIENIDKLHSSGYNYLDIAKRFGDLGDCIIIEDNIFIVYHKKFIILFEHSTYEIR